jgi:hypothetical protein
MNRKWIGKPHKPQSLDEHLADVHGSRKTAADEIPESEKLPSERYQLGDWFFPVSRLYLHVEHLLTDVQRRVYLCLASHIDYRTCLVKRSHQKLAEELVLDRRTVMRAVLVLKAMKLIVVVNPGDRMNAVTYEVVMPRKDGSEFAVASAKQQIREVPKRPYGRKPKKRRAA